MEREGREAAGRFLVFVPVSARTSERYVLGDPARGATMDQIANWMQSNWYELGSLLAQFTFLFAGLWLAQKILKTMRASQQQVAALLRLSITDGLERPEETGAAPRPTPGAVTASMLSPPRERAWPARMSR